MSAAQDYTQDYPDLSQWPVNLGRALTIISWSRRMPSVNAGVAAGRLRWLHILAATTRGQGWKKVGRITSKSA
jgi:hypothetical protein